MSKLAHLLAITVAFAHVAVANFDMFRMHGQQDLEFNRWGTQPNGYMLFNDEPRNCDDVHPFEFWWERDDVSGDKLGVVCDGKCWVTDVSSKKRCS